MGFTVLATATAITVFAVVVIALVIHEVRLSIARRKRRAALEYLLKATEPVYFYERPVSKCLEKGIVWELAWDGLGDFTRPMGYLVLYALGAKGSGNAQIHWAERYDRGVGQCYYSAYVVFDYCGWQWMLDLRGHGLDEYSFKRYKDSMSSDFAIYDYWDLSRRERHLAENCTDPERSKLAPDSRYREMDFAEFEFKTEQLVKALVA